MSPIARAASVSEVPVVFALVTVASDDHPHRHDKGYTHRCDVTLFGRAMWSLWGKSAEEAEQRARQEIGFRLGVLRGY